MKFLYIIIIFFCYGCSLKQLPEELSLEEKMLKVTKHRVQAVKISQDIEDFALSLKQKYGLISFAQFNNFLINIGLKKRGLCWELAFDMLELLKSKKYNVDYYIAGANIGKYFTEHNALVITCKKCSFEDGVIIDIWRNGGEVYAQDVKKDTKYNWKQRGEIR